MPTVKQLQAEARRRGCRGYSKMKKKADLEEIVQTCGARGSPKASPKAKAPPKAKASPKAPVSKGCFESESSAVACFQRLIDQYPVLRDKCACPSEVPSLQKASGASVLLKKDDKIVGVVDDQGVMRKMSPPLKAPPSPPPLPTFTATKPMQEALKNTKPLKSAEREDVKNVTDVSDLLADIRKGKKLRHATPAERKAIKQGGLEDSIARAMQKRRKAIYGE